MLFRKNVICYLPFFFFSFALFDRFVSFFFFVAQFFFRCWLFSLLISRKYLLSVVGMGLDFILRKIFICVDIIFIYCYGQIVQKPKLQYQLLGCDFCSSFFPRVPSSRMEWSIGRESVCSFLNEWQPRRDLIVSHSFLFVVVVFCNWLTISRTHFKCRVFCDLTVVHKIRFVDCCV